MGGDTIYNVLNQLQDSIFKQVENLWIYQINKWLSQHKLLIVHLCSEKILLSIINHISSNIFVIFITVTDVHLYHFNFRVV